MCERTCVLNDAARDGDDTYMEASKVALPSISARSLSQKNSWKGVRGLEFRELLWIPVCGWRMCSRIGCGRNLRCPRHIDRRGKGKRLKQNRKSRKQPWRLCICVRKKFKFPATASLCWKTPSLYHWYSSYEWGRINCYRWLFRGIEIEKWE